MTSLMVWVSLDIFSIIPNDFIARRKNAQVAMNGDATQPQGRMPKWQGMVTPLRQRPNPTNPPNHKKPW